MRKGKIIMRSFGPVEKPEAEKKQKRFCWNCGGNLSIDGRHCVECGVEQSKVNYD